MHFSQWSHFVGLVQGCSCCSEWVLANWHFHSKKTCQHSPQSSQINICSYFDLLLNQQCCQHQKTFPLSTLVTFHMQANASSLVWIRLLLLQLAFFPNSCLLLLQKQVAISKDPKVSHKAGGWSRISGHEKHCSPRHSQQLYHQSLTTKMTRKQGWYSRVKVSFLPGDIIIGINALCAHMANPAMPQHSAKPEQEGILWFRSWMKPQRSTKTRLSISLSSIDIQPWWKMRLTAENKSFEKAKTGLWLLKITCAMNDTLC